MNVLLLLLSIFCSILPTVGNDDGNDEDECCCGDEATFDNRVAFNAAFYMQKILHVQKIRLTNIENNNQPHEPVFDCFARVRKR